VIRNDQIEHASRTDVGVRRSHNQDSHTVLLAPDEEHWRDHGSVFLVADGMGAHAVGELASAMACNIIPHTYQKHCVTEGIVAALTRAFREANGTIYDRGVQNPEFKGMGTTSTALVLRSNEAWIGHVGDSRAYRIRNGSVQQLSFDHSLLWEKARRQHVSPEEMEGVPSNVIVRSLGPDSEVEVDIQGPHPLEPGDTFLLCSDGLSGQVNDEEIGALAATLPPAEACQFLIDLANIRGGPDNITVIVTRITQAKDKGKEHEETPAAPKVPLYKKVPWPLWILLAGILLAGVAVAQVATKSGGETTFIMAALVIVAGIIALGVYQFLEKHKKKSAQPAIRTKAKVFREADCRVNGEFIDEMNKLRADLLKQAKEQHWEFDQETCRRHHTQSEQHLKEARFAAALRETCRSMRPVLDALQRSRQKSEAFQPKYDGKKR
jgi:protein phosphatase